VTLATQRIASRHITAVILAGGRGSRMGGVDKGLQLFNGQALALHAVQRLAPQVGALIINANRNQAAYEALAQPLPIQVHADAPDLPEFAGPLAGFLVGLQHCQTPWLLTVPCDTPLLPLDLVARLADALAREQADIAMACAPETQDNGETVLRKQPVFCLLRTALLPSLVQFTQAGGSKIAAWTGQHATAWVPFNEAHDSPQAFFNANTLAQLKQLEQL
jgi:molybdenum cofactor guanylyltransferase